MNRPAKQSSLSRKRPRSKLGMGGDREANQRAAVILDVLAGLRTPAEAAQVLQVAVARYYVLERQALEGLAAACQSKPRGKRPRGARQELLFAQREVERLRRECQRHKALVRATHRAVGLPEISEPSDEAKTGKRRSSSRRRTSRRRRRPTVRALRAAQDLRENSAGNSASGALEPTEVVDPGSTDQERRESHDDTSRSQTAGSPPRSTS